MLKLSQIADAAKILADVTGTVVYLDGGQFVYDEPDPAHPGRILLEGFYCKLVGDVMFGPLLTDENKRALNIATAGRCYSSRGDTPDRRRRTRRAIILRRMMLRAFGFKNHA